MTRLTNLQFIAVKGYNKATAFSQDMDHSQRHFQSKGSEKSGISSYCPFAKTTSRCTFILRPGAHFFLI